MIWMEFGLVFWSGKFLDSILQTLILFPYLEREKSRKEYFYLKE
ncbi:hypothetical protein LEP1GSC199_2940 [Leptospira vanthielii serovar Holland str. Waz Holland = ATCC 700522]|uniref:Uncharacterized protein n=1 Tax=Leptospira vanthielii serovar Holland str. Waz Holland = ATCC 700522 TaxID=1218591 RepID=N1W087_9LEPT|nr:hypothetical protein LEP1GSC199_2940 [Leptospira vanthielii serovar Holland str. Waz Holland = ATCC 700522]